MPAQLPEVIPESIKVDPVDSDFLFVPIGGTGPLRENESSRGDYLGKSRFRII